MDALFWYHAHTSQKVLDTETNHIVLNRIQDEFISPVISYYKQHFYKQYEAEIVLFWKKNIEKY